IVTRCPLELKMKRRKEGQEWYGKISYQEHEEELEDPATVEKKIREGILTKPDLVDKGTEETVVEIVHNEVIQLKKGYMIKSLPRLEEQIEEKLKQTQRDLDRYGNGPPSDEAERLFFLIDDAISLTTGEELKCREGLNVFSILRREFGRWKAHLEDSGENCKKIESEVEEYEERYRGRELPGFINYKTFEVMVKEQIRLLEEPAIRKLKDVGVLKYCAHFSWQIAGIRLADQIPLVIRYEMLQQSAMQLQREMLQMLQDKENVDFLLKEDYDTGTKRAALQSRMKRLTEARSYLVEF
ncbi:hypothetical protein XENOCAPTIV_004096, partial [Xenoophorus captivus]